MAALWNVTVLKVEGAEATLSLRMAHPDAGEFSTAKSFGLRLLYEQAWDLGSQFQYQALGPLGEAIQESNIYDDAWLFSQQAQFIAQFEQTGSRGKAYNETALIAEIQRTL
ncbi:MAG TPA: hypothetical protein ENJ82_06395, partial [Bacteroidetes bacterium]|nr:hypothetical protein [Bacteroidota bacterium]